MGNAEKWCKNHSPGLGVGAAGKRVRGASQRRRGGEEERRLGEERLPRQLPTALLSHRCVCVCVCVCSVFRGNNIYTVTHIVQMSGEFF